MTWMRRKGGGVMSSKTSYRAIWISDVHLGTPLCKAEALYDFLINHEAESLYLVGDIVDGWNVGPGWHWTSAQTAVVEEIARWHRSGVRVVFLPGNHDEANVDLAQTLFGSVAVRYQLLHKTAEGRRMLVIHGHQFDGSLNPNRWFSRVGSHAYGRAMQLNHWSEQRLRFSSEAGGRSVISFVTDQVRRAFEYLTDFRESAVFEGARQYRADGVICGHIHRAEQRFIGSVMYVNDGDWVRSCTALVEDNDGVLRLVEWRRGATQIAAPVAAGAAL
jgi:UDP-2,3-diacylglucosamine pyrophosphatase LpxH